MFHNFYQMSFNDPNLSSKALNAWSEVSQAPEMTENTARDVGVIAQSIEGAAARWAITQALPTVSYAGVPLQREGLWSSMGFHPTMSVLPVLEQYYAGESGEGKVAIELGSGNSPAVPFLLQRGWKVIAVDNLYVAMAKLLMNHRTEIKSGQLQVVAADISTYQPDSPADLVIASDILPFIDPAKFMGTWKRIHDLCVKEEGFLVGNFFRSLTELKSAPLIYALQEMGAWTLPDRRMVRPLLTHAGYEIKACQFRQDIPGHDHHSIQFVAQKKTQS